MVANIYPAHKKIINKVNDFDINLLINSSILRNIFICPFLGKHIKRKNNNTLINAIKPLKS